MASHAPAGRVETWPEVSGEIKDTTRSICACRRGIKVSQLDPPHTVEAHLMREMGLRIARKHAQKLRPMALFLGFKVPFVLLPAAIFAPGGLAVAAAPLAALSRWPHRKLGVGLDSLFRPLSDSSMTQRSR